MPIYEYRCASCGAHHEVLQKLSDPLLVTCPTCHKDALVKQVSAAGFQLKGSGWYVTDFRNGSKPTPKTDTASDAKPATAESKPDGGDAAKATETKSESKPESSPAAPAAVPAKSSSTE